MIRWDYIVVHFKTADELSAEMQKNGDMGWKVVSAGPIFDHGQGIWYAVMEREIREPKSQG